MKSEFITLIWLANFENRTQLSDYVDWKYSENEDDPVCDFANDIGLEYFDSAFLETAFAGSLSELLAQIDDLSFIENFKEHLLAAINNSNCSGKNAIISLTGKKDVNAGINENLFGFIPSAIHKNHLAFIGHYRYNEAESNE